MRLSKPLFNRFMICVPISVPFETIAYQKEHDKSSEIFPFDITLMGIDYVIGYPCRTTSIYYYTFYYFIALSHKDYLNRVGNLPNECVDESGSVSHPSKLMRLT